jgi:hypothetical protein
MKLALTVSFFCALLFNCSSKTTNAPADGKQPPQPLNNNSEEKNPTKPNEPSNTVNNGSPKICESIGTTEALMTNWFGGRGGNCESSWFTKNRSYDLLSASRRLIHLVRTLVVLQ